MFNQEILKKIIGKYGRGLNKNEFGSGKYHLYLYVKDKDRIYEEEEVVLRADRLDGVLEILSVEEDSIAFIPYEQITELSVTNDEEEEESS